MKHLRILALLVALFLGTAHVSHAHAESSGAEDDSIPYDSLEEALKDLHANPAVTFRDEKGWIVALDTKTSVAWLLTPVGHPAYPSIVRRRIVNRADGAHLETKILCLASQAVCDKYFASVQ
jgi:hypothetical protein